MSEFRIKEVEVGGVFNLDRYENVRVAIRVVVNKPEDIGAVFDKLGVLVEQTAKIQKVCRRWKDLAKNVEWKIGELRKRAKEELEEGKRALEKARKEAEQLLKKLNLNLLPEDVRKKVEEDPVNAFKLGIVSTECLYIRDHEQYVRRAKQLEEEAAKLEEALEKLRQLYSEMKAKLHEGKLAEAAEAAAKLWEAYETMAKPYIEW